MASILNLFWAPRAPTTLEQWAYLDTVDRVREAAAKFAVDVRYGSMTRDAVQRAAVEQACGGGLGAQGAAHWVDAARLRFAPKPKACAGFIAGEARGADGSSQPCAFYRTEDSIRHLSRPLALFVTAAHAGRTISLRELCEVYAEVALWNCTPPHGDDVADIAKFCLTFSGSLVHNLYDIRAPSQATPLLWAAATVAAAAAMVVVGKSTAAARP